MLFLSSGRYGGEVSAEPGQEVKGHEGIYNIGRLYGMGGRQIYFVCIGARIQGIYRRINHKIKETQNFLNVYILTVKIQHF